MEAKTMLNKLVWLLAALIALAAALPLGAIADEEGYVNPFLEENLELYYEALDAQGYIVPGAAYTADNDGDDQAHRYGPMQEGFIVDTSEVTWRHENGSDFSLRGRFEDDKTHYFAGRYDDSRLKADAYYSVAEYAKVENLPDRLQTTWSDRQEFGLGVTSRKLKAGWEHFDVTRDPYYSGLNEYESDRGFVDFDVPVPCGDLKVGAVYSMLDSEQLMADDQATISSNLTWTWRPQNETRIKLGLGTVQAESPIDAPNYADQERYVASLRLDRHRWPGEDWTVTLFGNYDWTDMSPAVNTHWDEWANFGLKLSYDGWKGTDFEIGAKIEDVDVTRLDLDAVPTIDLLVNGTDVFDVDEYYIDENPSVTEVWIKSRSRISKVGSWTNDLRVRQYDDMHEYVSSNPHYWPLYPETVFTYKTGLYLPVSDNSYVHLSDRFRWYEARTFNESVYEGTEISDNLLSFSFTANPREDWSGTAYLELIQQAIQPDFIEGDGIDMFGLGVDLWHDFGGNLAFSGGLYYGEADEGDLGFEYMKVHGLVEYGPWGFYYEHVDSDTEDDSILVFDAYTAKVVYKIEL